MWFGRGPKLQNVLVVQAIKQSVDGKHGTVRGSLNLLPTPDRLNCSFNYICWRLRDGKELTGMSKTVHQPVGEHEPRL